jgi:apolipoprotein N-acyltransferase
MSDKQASERGTRRRASFLRGLFGGLGFAALMFVSFPPAGLWWLTFLAPTALLLAVPMDHRSGHGRWLGFGVLVGVAPMYATHFVWVTTASVLGYVPLVIYLSLYPALLVMLLHRLRRIRTHWSITVLLTATLALGVDFLRGHIVMDGASWYLPGQPLIESPVLSAPAALGGFFLVGWMTWLLGACLASGVQRKRVLPFAAGAAGFASWYGMGYVLNESSFEQSDNSIDIAVVQTNVPQDIRRGWLPEGRVRSWIDLVELTFEAKESLPKHFDVSPEDGTIAEVYTTGLIVWPEGMYPGYTLERDALDAERAQRLVWVIEDEFGSEERVPATLIADELFLLQERIGVPILVSAIGYDDLRFRTESDGIYYEPDGQYNSVFIVDRPAAPVARYDKMHLTPFGEVMPYISNWPWLERALLAVGARGMSFNWDAGTRPTVLETTLPGGKVVRIAAPVCFEATRGDFCRDLVFQQRERVADVMVNPTNDVWFDFWDAGRWTHGLLARWRCVELDTPMIRAANSGVSMFIDRRGRIVHAGVNVGEHAGQTANVAGVLTAAINIGGGVTMYARFGDWPGWLGIIVLGVGVLLGVRRESSAPPHAASTEESARAS